MNTNRINRRWVGFGWPKRKNSPTGSEMKERKKNDGLTENNGQEMLILHPTPIDDVNVQVSRSSSSRLKNSSVLPAE